MEYLRDYVWMRKGDAPPERVQTDNETLARKMAEGFRQCDPLPAQEED